MKQLSQTEVKQFINDASSNKKDKYTRKGYSFTPIRGIGKQDCKSCG